MSELHFYPLPAEPWVIQTDTKSMPLDEGGIFIIQRGERERERESEREREMKAEGTRPVGWKSNKGRGGQL